MGSADPLDARCSADPAKVPEKMYIPYPIYDRSGVDDDDDAVRPGLVTILCEAVDVGTPEVLAAPPPPSVRCKAAIVVGGLSIFLTSSLLALIVLGSSYHALFSPGLLALTFGLRHAVDVDHIAAIDNVTRKLVSEGKQPLTVGVFFSLGHSTVVIIMSIAVAISSGYAAEQIPKFAHAVGLWGAIFSSFVLTMFGLFNSRTAVRLWMRWRRLRHAARQGGGAAPQAQPVEHDHDGVGTHTHVVTVTEDGSGIEGLGCLMQTRCCAAIFAAIDRPWKMYPVGFLFGLGFDTATEVALLAVTATMGAKLPWGPTLVLPLLFTAGMSFIDGLNGIFMLWAYGWANMDAILQVWFNLSLTAVSAILALFVALMQVLGLLQEELGLEGGLWAPIVAFGEHSDIIGGATVGFFVLSLAAAGVYARLCLWQGRGGPAAGAGSSGAAVPQD